MTLAKSMDDALTRSFDLLGLKHTISACHHRPANSLQSFPTLDLGSSYAKSAQQHGIHTRNLFKQYSPNIWHHYSPKAGQDN